MSSYRRPVQEAVENNGLDGLTSESASAPVGYRRPVQGYRRSGRALSPVGAGPKAARDMPFPLQAPIHGALQTPPQTPSRGWPQVPISASVPEGPSKQLAEAVTAALAYPGYGLVVTPTPAHVAVTVTPAAGTSPADVERLAHVAREVLALRGLGRWRALVQIRPPEIVLIRRVEEVPDP